MAKPLNPKAIAALIAKMDKFERKNPNVEFPRAAGLLQLLKDLEKAKSSRAVKKVTGDIDNYIKRGIGWGEPNTPWYAATRALYEYAMARRRATSEAYDTTNVDAAIAYFKKYLTGSTLKEVVKILEDIRGLMLDPSSLGLYEETEFSTMREEMSWPLQRIRKILKREVYGWLIERGSKGHAIFEGVKKLKKIKKKSHMANPVEWMTYRTYLRDHPQAVREARRLLTERYGEAFADALMEFIRTHREVPSEDTFADPLFQVRPEIFSQAWAERRDLKGRPIGDRVDVTTDAVSDLWAQLDTTLNRDGWDAELDRMDETDMLWKFAAPDSFVEITREDLEAWLNTLPLKGKWKLKTGRVSIYLLPISKSVGISLSSTIGSKDTGMGRGKASMNLALVSLITGKVLNKKAMGQSYFKRTTNWKKTWKIGFDRMVAAYKKSQGFYDALAEIDDRDKYREDILDRIVAFEGWESDNTLSDFYSRVQRGGVLTMKQLALLESTLKHDAKSSPAKPVIDQKMVERLRLLWTVAKKKGDPWLMDFAQSIGERLKKGLELSSKQEAALERNLRQHRVGADELRAIIHAAAE